MTVQYTMHVGICVRDLDRSIRFYRDGLGFEEAGGLEISGEPTTALMELPDVELRAVYLERDVHHYNGRTLMEQHTTKQLTAKNSLVIFLRRMK